MTFQKQGLPLKRPLEAEEGPQAEQQYLARLQELQSASDTVLADITTPQCSFHTGAFTQLEDLRGGSFGVYTSEGLTMGTTVHLRGGSGAAADGGEGVLVCNHESSPTTT